jgi:GrpB-like predicted nucleotidyltransferase (UPF0157 family)
LYFPYKPELMHWFCKPWPARRTHHLHLVPGRSQLWSDRLVFRDYLRRSAAAAAEYTALKIALAGRHRTDREAYTRAKGEVVRSIIGRARSRMIEIREEGPLDRFDEAR